MGAKDSKPSCISYEEAVKRVTDSELRRIKDAFKRSAGTAGSVLSKCAFTQDVLGDGVPSVVADWLYTACGGTAKGIAFKELLCGLVLLTKGTQDEKIKFLWTLYCNESGTHILKQEFQKAMQIETTYQSNATNSPNNSTTNCSNNNNNNQTVANRNNHQQQLQWSRYQVSLFGQNDRVSFEQFKSWIQMHRGATALSKWLLQDACVNLSSELETPTFYQSLAGVTHLEEQDIGDLEKVFWLLKGAAVTGQLDLESLGPLVSPPVPRAALGGVFLAFDENHDGHIDFKELCCGVSAACRGPSVERSKFCFKVFDIDRDGVLSFVEIRQMVDILLSVARESNAAIYRNLTHERVLAELYRRATRADEGKANGNETDIISASNVPEFKFTQEDFLIWSIESSSNLVQPFLDLLFEVCHIVLGLRPQCRHLEGDIVRGWLSREVRRGYKVGQFWYLISSDWWQHWSQYTHLSSPSSSCVHCKTTGTSYANNRAIAGAGGVPSLMPNGGTSNGGAVDEAMICDESFTSNSTESMGDLLGTGDSSSLGSGSSGISYGRHAGSAPGTIDNSCLIAPNIYKQIPTLTGEGGRLKRDLTLVQHRDFELVPDSLWKALAQWYGGPLPLPRQVIQPHSNAGDVELELYPLNLRILRHQSQPPPHQQQHGQMGGNSAWASMSGGYGALTTGSYPTTVSSVPPVLHPPKKYLAYTAAFSRLATVKQVAEFLCQRLKLKPEDIRLWHLVPTPTGISEFPYLLEEDHLTLHELSIGDNDQVLLEIRNKDLTWPEELGSLALSQGSGSTSMDRRGTVASIQSQHPPGATGLHNLGNTCFMNAALQVLFNTQPLTQYFIQKKHLYELNTSNKMGTKGQLVLRYAELLRDVWTASTRSIAPLKLRFCVTKHAPQFSGGGQHDSQELLDWLLDSLHEDLNRVMEKPYTELKDSDGRSDVIVATEAWSQHHARNQSIIVDLFYGQLKSKVTCQGCGRDSVRFDPFSLLSLPLPVENYTYCEVLVMLLDGSVPVKYGLRLNSEMKYWDLKKHLSELCGLEPDQMLICELSNSQIRLVLPNEHRIKPSTACELYAYELPKVDSVLRSRAGSELGINIEKGLKDIQRNQDPHQLTTSSINTTISSTSSSASSSSSTATADDTAAITGRKPGGSSTGRTGDDGGATLLTNGILYNGGEGVGGGAGGGGGGGAGGGSGTTMANRRTSATSKVSRCFGNTLCMPPNMLCFKHIPEISTSPDSTFIYGAGQYNELTGYGTNGYGNANSAIGNHQHASATQQPSKDPNRSKTISTTNLLNNADNGWSNGSSAGGYDSPNAHHLHHPYDCNDCDNVYMGEDMPPYGDQQQHGDAISLSAISKRPHPLGGGTAGGLAGQRKTNYLIAVHRKLSRQDTYFLSHHKSKPGLFGVPLLIPCYDGVTNKELYCSVWLQVARLLSPLPPTPPDQSNHATDCDDSLGYDFPFTLRAVGSGGRMCALCPWSRFCRGCEIPCNDEPLLQGLICSAPGSASNSSTPNLSSREQTPTLRRKFYAANSSGSSSLDGTTNHHQQQQPASMGSLPGTSSSPISSLQSSINARSIQIAIDWDPTALHLRYQSTRERLWTVHESVAVCRKQQTEPVDLDHCLRAFTSEEKLEQWYHCSHCKQKKPATKKLQIWKLPPILIVHLKRFNYVNGKWVKSQKVVNFPYEDFDPTPYLASVPQETILRHRDLLEGVASGPRGDGRNRDCHEEFVEFDREMSMIDEASDEISLSSLRINGVKGSSDGGDSDDCGNNNNRQSDQSADEEQRSSIIIPAIAGSNHVASARYLHESDLMAGGGSSSYAGGSDSPAASTSTVRIKSASSVRSSDSTRRQRLVSTSLTKTPVIDGEFTDFHKHHLKPECDPFELKYQLYAAVCHSGMLNGGHYISYAANPNGSWYCYNDSSCREIPTRPKIDPSTAYLLFYERRDLDYGPYLPKVDGRQLPSEGLLDIDDSDNDLKKMCSLM
ncbi:ubiquitin carboxyl-terminal hydrolase 32 isoform X2 [Anopheles arabiensis]|uniref:ubiquitin carboxyl-terminal hydrolase 32 isoform X2 n=1 Tax=Anopheles arabiensis TaxID=7173 RepID=UPI001AADAFED|nr:ubiquitin carboxyl-terminal hydrolase 32 isoform X2 [Anopheles arabiensis]